MGGFAWVTLATNDSYSLGAMVLAHSLKQVGTVHQLVVLVTPGVTGVMREKLSTVFNVVKEVNILDSKDEANLRLLKRPELGVTFTKLHCWRLTQFEKCVFLDADTMVLANPDELFDREEFSAAPDVGWPDCFNSGVFVYRPSEETYSKLIQFAVERGSFDGGDQGLLNLYFCDWAHKDISKHLPFIYNMCSTACYSYLPAFKQFGPTVKIIHFIGNTKPWLQYFDTETQHVQVVSDIQHLQGVVQQWWNIFCSCIHPMLSPAMAGLAGAFARLTIGAPRTPEQTMLEDQLRRQGWEVGNIDYMGRDSFDNIWSKICETLSAEPVVQSYDPLPPTDPTQSVATEFIAAKQVVTEPTQPITNVTEQKIVIEKEQLEPITDKPSKEIGSETGVPTSEPSVITVEPELPPLTGAIALEPTQTTVPVPEPVVSAPESVVSAPEPVVSAPEPVLSTPAPVVLVPETIVPEPVVQAPELVQTSVPFVSKPEAVVSAPEPVIPESVVSEPDPVVLAPESAVSASEVLVPAPGPVLPTPETVVPASEPVVSAPEPVIPAPESIVPAAEPAVPTLKPVVLTPAPVVPAPEPAASVHAIVPPPPPAALASAPVVSTSEASAPTPLPAVPASIASVTKRQTEPVSQAPVVPSQTVASAPTPASPIPKPEAPQPESSKPESATQLPKSQPQPPKPTNQPPKKQPEPTKPTPPPATKSTEKPASQSGEATKAVTESSKSSINAPKPAPEQAAGQKPASAKEAAPSKTEATSGEGPTPPPRKGASGQTAGGAKKSAKGKK